MKSKSNELSIVKDISKFKIVMCDNMIWITNYIKILLYTKEKLRIKIKNNVVVIMGADIDITMLDKKELVLSGKFNNVYIENPVNVEK